MRRVKLTVAYDGTNYCGWQIQPNGETIQGMLNRHLSELLCEEIHTIGASRTDSGVHARGNVAVFETSARMPIEKISYAMNARLPEDIRIWESKEVPAEFHPRFTKTIKTYEYRILNKTFADPTCRLNSLFCYNKLDVELMKKAAGYLVGEHDFKSFATENPQATTTVRTIYDIHLDKAGDMITLYITGNGFLYNMVRIIVGTLLEVGKGCYPPEHITEILDARDRSAAGPTARAHGLTLAQIRYPEWE
jgi:tRNA pseudouridine38-40 synthase